MDKSTEFYLSRKYGAQFVSALLTTLGHEGGWSNHPNDRGGLTYMGITSLTLDRYNTIAGTYLRMEDLTSMTVADIYYRLFWKGYNVERFPFALRPFMFDWVVHSGSFAIKSAQRYIGTKADGIAGRKTQEAFAAAVVKDGSETVLHHLVLRRMDHLCRMVKRDPNQAVFLVGWWNRVKNWL